MQDNSRRSFFKKAAAAAGVVAAAGATKAWISTTPAVAHDDAGATYAADMAALDKALAASQLTMMTEEEKKQRLDDLLNCHYREIA